MRDEKQLLKNLNDYFLDKDKSWFFLKGIIEEVIEEYSKNLEKCEIMISEEYYDHYDDTDQAPFIVLTSSLREIGVNFQNPNLSFSNKGIWLKMDFIT